MADWGWNLNSHLENKNNPKANFKRSENQIFKELNNSKTYLPYLSSTLFISSSPR